MVGRVALRLSVPPGVLGPLALTSDGDNAWIAAGGTPRGNLYLVDAAGGRKLLEVAQVGWAPGGLIDAGSRLWVENTIGDGSRPSSSAQNTVDVVDKTGGRVDVEVPLPNPGLMVGDAEYAWVVSNNSTLDRIELPGARSTLVPDLSQIGDVVAMAFDSRLWLATRSPTGIGSRLVNVDPTTGGSRNVIDSPDSINAIAAGGGKTWLLIQDPGGHWFATRLAESTFDARIPLPDNLAASTFVTVGQIGWVASNDGLLYRIDTGGGSVDRVEITPALDGVPIAIAGATGGVWVLTPESIYQIAVPK